MNFKVFYITIFLSLFLINGCGPSYHIVKKIPRTQENLQGYRECQRTVIVARGGDELEYNRLFNNCLKTLDASESRVEGYPKTPEGCEPMVKLREYLDGPEIYYYLCK